MRLFDVKFLSPAQIGGFDNYVYSSMDTSPLAVYVSHPFWNQVVKLYPRWLAPNVLTLSGFVLVMASFGVVSAFDYGIDGAATVPNGVWLLCAVCTFLAHTLDGTDGKQARRTGSGGPTGELFDHGIDSWLTIPFTITAYTVFGRGPDSQSPPRMLYCLMIVQFIFLATHWEKYNTGVLYLSWGYDFSQYFLVIFYLATFWFGHGYWTSFSILGRSVSCAAMFEASLYSTFFFSLAMSAYNLYDAHRRGVTRQPTAYEALLPLLSTVVLFALAEVWARHSPGAVLVADPRAFMWAVGTVFSNIACRLIVAQMTNTRVQPLNALLVPFAAASFVSVAGVVSPSAELLLVRVLAVAVSALHVHYGVCLVRQLCDHFKIRCFKLSKVE